MIKEFQKEYRWLSNFAPCDIFYEGTTYSSVEHAYQAAKTLNPEERKWFVGVTAGKAKGLGRKIAVRDDWEDIKLEVMRELLTKKYTQEPYVSKLILTGDKHIQEGNYWNDKFWGVCLKTGVGCNNLGMLIMDIRKAVKSIKGVL